MPEALAKYNQGLTMKTISVIAASVIITAQLVAADTTSESTELGSMSIISHDDSLANSIITAKSLQQISPMTDVLNTINHLPGVNVQQADAFGMDDWQTQVTMRGFATDQIGFTIDGVPNGQTNYGGGAKPARFTEVENLESVSVSQGSADISSTSNQSLGGTIMYNSGMPADEEGMKFSRTQGSNNMERTFVRYDTGKFNEEQTSAYVSYSDTFSNRWIGTGSNGKFERTHVEGKIKHVWDENIISFSASYNDRYENDYDNVTLEDFNTNPTTDGLTWFWTGDPAKDTNFAETWAGLRQDTMLHANLDLTLPADVRLIAVPYYHHQTGEGHWMPPYIILTEDGSYDRQYTDPDSGEYTASHRSSIYNNDRFGTTLRLEKEIENHALAVGMWYEFQDRDNSREWYEVLDEATSWDWNTKPYWLQFDNTYKTTTNMGYIEDKMSFLGDSLSVNVGLKMHVVDTTLINNLDKSQFSQTSQSELLPQIGAVYKINNANQVFASYSQNFSAKPDYLLGESVKDPSLKPETADNFDLGYRYNGTKLAATATVYMSKFKDRIGSRDLSADEAADIYFTEATSAYFNIGGIDSYGLELGATYQVTDRISVYGSYTYNQSEYSESNPTEGIVEGNKVIAQPENMGAIDITYKHNGYLLGLNGKYTGERYSKLDNSEQAPDYTLWNLVAGYSKGVKSDFIKSVNAQVNVFNLFDEKYLAGVFNPGLYSLGASRNVTFTFGASF